MVKEFKANDVVVYEANPNYRKRKTSLTLQKSS